MRPRTALAALAGALLLTAGGVALSPPASAASLVEVTGFGNNPGNMRMHIYVPDTRPASPAILVAMHGGGSDPVSIMSMVTHAQQQYGGDPGQVYATGSSSGGMMTQHMLAIYPDVFKAGASFMGVPFNCFANAADFPPGSSQCTGGNMDRTPQQWGDAVRQAYPGYTGPRPRVQLWHGTNDNLVPYQLLQESIEQWTNVFGLSQTPTSTDTPQSNWNRRRYADTSGTVQVEAYSIQGAGHSLPMSGMALAAIQFFGLDSSTPAPLSPSASPASPQPSASPPPSPRTAAR